MSGLNVKDQGFPTQSRRLPVNDERQPGYPPGIGAAVFCSDITTACRPD